MATKHKHAGTRAKQVSTSPPIHLLTPAGTPRTPSPSCTIYHGLFPGQSRCVPEKRLAEVSLFLRSKLASIPEPAPGLKKKVLLPALPESGVLALDCFLDWAFTGDYVSIVREHAVGAEEELMLHVRVYKMALFLQAAGLRSLAYDMAMEILDSYPPVGPGRFKVLEVVFGCTGPGDGLRIGVAMDVSKNFVLYQRFVFKSQDRKTVTELLGNNPDLAYQIVVHGNA